MTWAALLVLAAGTFAFRAAGPLLIGERTPPPGVQAVLTLLPAALLAGLVATQTLGAGQALTIDARVAGVAVAAVAVWRGAPFVVVVLIGTGTAALLRLLGAP